MDVSLKLLSVTFATVAFLSGWFSTENLDYFRKSGYPKGKTPDNKKGQENSPGFCLVVCQIFSRCLKHAPRSSPRSTWYLCGAHIAVLCRYPNKRDPDLVGLGTGELRQPSKYAYWYVLCFVSQLTLFRGNLLLAPLETSPRTFYRHQ